MKDNLNKSLKSVLDEADNLIKDVGTREATAAENQRLRNSRRVTTGKNPQQKTRPFRMACRKVYPGTSPVPRNAFIRF